MSAPQHESMRRGSTDPDSKAGAAPAASAAEEEVHITAKLLSMRPVAEAELHRSDTIGQMRALILEESGLQAPLDLTYQGKLLENDSLRLKDLGMSGAVVISVVRSGVIGY
eukprot:TRINITY_DN39485_c0_g1_i1.p2 TRINITY_DN39485_c0_g1~~TRINITY_DN39485_c0_g1_i1.p2  ORF type:complete len:111 (+),score=26.15 TRINITY_DN39485_c0_g1_i1:83-415(+)